MADAGLDELKTELVALRRQNEHLSRLVAQAIRMGERVLAPARDAVIAYNEYVRMTAVSFEAAQPAASHLADVMDELSRLVREGTTTEGAKHRGQKPSAPIARRRSSFR